ncbi:MAG: aldehyde dehydrogenase, partial [FCB group bacterium]|nr:aldehyde dehydrogenase [FCB group bacterium]
MKAKGILPGTRGEGEEWLVLTMLFRLLGILERSLTDIRRYGRPKIPGGFRRNKQGRILARSFPHTLVDRIFYSFVSGDVLFPEGTEESDILENQAKIYSGSAGGNVCLVLAAGNLSVLSVIDFMYKLFVENQVVIVKTNPVNDYINPFLEKAFAPLIDQGFLRIIHGGAEEGRYLCQHPDIDELHLTGSDKTFDAIVFGSGEQGVKNKNNREPQSDKRFTAELGNITPVIVVPGPWSESDVQSQAVKLVSWFSVNAGFNCITPRLLIQHKNWSKRDILITAITNLLKTVETRNAYYPGAQDRHRMFLDHHPRALQIGETPEGHLPWTFIKDVDPQNEADICFSTEPFCSLVSETGLESESVVDFIDKAVDFANTRVWGSLAAVVLV